NGDMQVRVTMIMRLREGKSSAHCSECGEKFDLPKEEVLRPRVQHLTPWLQREKAAVELRKTYETYLGNVTGFWHQEVKPRCYLSHVDDDAELVKKLAKDLGLAGIELVKDRSAVTDGDHVVIIQSNAY